MLPVVLHEYFHRWLWPVLIPEVDWAPRSSVYFTHIAYVCRELSIGLLYHLQDRVPSISHPFVDTGAGASQCVTPRGVRQFGGL